MKKPKTKQCNVLEILLLADLIYLSFGCEPNLFSSYGSCTTQNLILKAAMLANILINRTILHSFSEWGFEVLK